MATLRTFIPPGAPWTGAFDDYDNVSSYYDPQQAFVSYSQGETLLNYHRTLVSSFCDLIQPYVKIGTTGHAAPGSFNNSVQAYLIEQKQAPVDVLKAEATAVMRQVVAYIQAMRGRDIDADKPAIVNAIQTSLIKNDTPTGVNNPKLVSKSLILTAFSSLADALPFDTETYVNSQNQAPFIPYAETSGSNEGQDAVRAIYNLPHNDQNTS
jgi:hypothetical protein